MNLLVTGLCISRNLGGPAMALTLVDQLKKRLPDADFTFAIAPGSYRQEKKWADYYGLKIVRRDTAFSHIMNTNIFFRIARIGYRFLKGKTLSASDAHERSQIHEEFMEAYSNCDAVINMMGISYVGDGVRGPFEGLSSYSNLYYANKHKKPFTHFIQSFGPFDDWKVRFFAKRDFEQVDFVPARGKKSAGYCKSIVKNPEKVYDFPDTAILLRSADEQWVTDYLKKLNLSEKNYIVLSPSSVIYNMRASVGGSIGEDHVRSFYLIAKKLLSNNETLLFLPHMYSDNKSQCDREICRKVLSLLKNDVDDVSRCKIIEDDLDVWQAKALISKSKAAIVSRYHALVAAVSTGVPVVTVGWNIKYYDLMQYYGIESRAVDTRKNNPQQLAEKVFAKLAEYEAINYSEILREKQDENAKKVEFAFDLLCDWLKKHVK